MALKKTALLLFAAAVAFAAYGISGCVHGEHDDTPLTITTTTLPPGVSGSAYSYTLEAVGGKIPYTWAVESGGAGLPQGLYLSEGGNLTGTPTSDGSYAFTVVVTDSDKDVRVASKGFTLTVYTTDDVMITSSTVGPIVIDTAYESNLEAVGGVLPYTWSIVLGGYELTTGLYLSETGRITGRPTTVGVYTVEVRVDDDAGSFDTRNIKITVEETQVELAIVTGSDLGTLTRNVSTDIVLEATGGVQGTGYTWAVESGSAPLPTGLALVGDELQWTGGAGSPLGEHTFSIKVTDQATPPATVSQIFKVTIVP